MEKKICADLEVTKSVLQKTHGKLEAAHQKKPSLSPEDSAKIEATIAALVLKSVQDIIRADTTVEEILSMDLQACRIKVVVAACKKSKRSRSDGKDEKALHQKKKGSNHTPPLEQQPPSNQHPIPQQQQAVPQQQTPLLNA